MKTRIYQYLFTTLLALSCCIACDEDTDGAEDVQLLSFGPSGAQHGQEIVFIGTHLNEVSAIAFEGVTVMHTDFTHQTKEYITLVVPEATEEGKVALITDQDSIWSKTVFSLIVPASLTDVPASTYPGSTFTITGTYMNWIQEVWFAEDQEATILSQTLTHLEVAVPIAAQTGPVVLIGGGMDPVTLTSELPVEIPLPAIATVGPNPVERGGNLTLTGQDLDLAMAVKFKGVADPITTFISQSSTELVVTAPGIAHKGAVTLVAYSGIEVATDDIVTLTGDYPALPTLTREIFTDAPQNGFGADNYGGDIDINNITPVREGSISALKNYNGSWDAIRFNGSSIETSGATMLVFSLFGGAGTDGKVLSVILNGNWGITSVTVYEDEWFEYAIPLESLGNPETLEEWGLQAQGWSGDVYVDYVGIR